MAKTMYTEAERRRWVQRFERSEKTAAAFCRAHGLVHGTFSRWVREHGGRGDAGHAGPIEFVRLERGSEEKALELAVVVGRSKVVVRRGFDPKLLRDVVMALSDREPGT